MNREMDMAEVSSVATPSSPLYRNIISIKKKEQRKAITLQLQIMKKFSILQL